ncbi:unnamed protein product [Lactuca virosa]|uniref:Uncharacterized protein n=1 Tax=Lactuca virosa TaxID=75947 RepID=A0AAU9NS39_9ASTR|nr:unnamed protein product [Lactuca virosa]
MAEIAVTAVITVLCEKLISGDLMKLAGSEGIDSQLKKWKNTLPLIQAVLADASQKHITDKAVQLWVNNLQDLAYDIDDVLDDLATEAIRRNLNKEALASTSTGKLLKFFPNCCTNFTPHNFMYGRKMSSKLDEITTKLCDLVDQRKGLGLNVNVERSNITERRLEQTSLVVESKIMGREGDKVALMGKLLRNEECDQNVSIVSIVGMGGIGKTTLAKLLYNEQEVKDHFELRAWVCISEEFDVFNISNAIFEALGGDNKRFSNLDPLHVALKEKLSKKRFMLVLDDVWNEDHSKWELLQSPLLVGAPGSRIIVTTRSTMVASLMDSEESYGLDVLSNEDALSLFSQHAVGEKNFEKHPTLKSLGEGMVQKCGRLPLALKALGRVLKGNRNGDEWEKLLKSEIWDIDDGSEILPALRLSYYHLPPHLKQLFAYCSLFPKDTEFKKNELVLMWMAEGFLSQSKSMERLGHHYFEELLSRSFFQQSTNDEFEYTMHDLMNDLATSVAGEFFCRLDGEMDVSDTNEVFEKLRHLTFIASSSGSYRKLKQLQTTRLHTFLGILISESDYVYDELIHKLQFVRVLALTGITITEVPNSIGSLKHLRLPKSFAKLINLRHLDISKTPNLKKTPLGIGGLTSLQTLPKVFIEEGNGFKISNLKGLSDLQGRLSIKGLDTVKNSIEAKDAHLHQKKGLDVLKMEWSDVFDDSRNEMIEYEVLKELRPHPKLKKLKIFNNNGMRFPTWVGDPSFDQLTELKLCGCRSTYLPTLGHLCSLKKLVVERMNEVKTVGFELPAPTNSFPSLQVLEFGHMQGWQRWSINSGDGHETPTSFPRLHKLSIKCCPELDEVSIGLIPSLQVLHIEECSKVVLRSLVGLSSSLVRLKMVNVKGLTQLHGEELMHLRALEELHIPRCDELRYLWERESEACKSLVSLQKLEVWNCKNLVSSAEKVANVGISMESLKSVEFHDCETLESYNCPNSVERLVISSCASISSLTFSAVQEQPSPLTELIVGDCDNIKLQPKPIPAKDFSLSRLTSFDIISWKNLKSIPYEHFQSLTSLEDMIIQDCPSMDYSFPCGVWPPNLRMLSIGDLNKPIRKGARWIEAVYMTSVRQIS